MCTAEQPANFLLGLVGIPVIYESSWHLLAEIPENTDSEESTVLYNYVATCLIGGFMKSEHPSGLFWEKHQSFFGLNEAEKMSLCTLANFLKP